PPQLRHLDEEKAMMRNWFHFISLAAAMFFGLESVAAADTFRIRLTGARCADDPACHNRFHPAIKPVITVKPGDTVIMETRDAFDGQITPTSTAADADRKSTRLNSSHDQISYAVFCLKKKKNNNRTKRNTAK